MTEWLDLFMPGPRATWSVGQQIDFDSALRLSVELAFLGYGKTRPNPAVGAVLVSKNGTLLGFGWHHQAGQPHAEIEALRHWLAHAGQSDKLVAKDFAWDFSDIDFSALSGAKMFVTLEPCAFEGRTPSCAKTLARLPLAEVIVLLKDPHPKVSGKGFEILREAGINVRCLESENSDYATYVEAARSVCEHFLETQAGAKTFVSLKVATSLDGMMALDSGESQWITSEKSRNFARFLRGAHQALLVGKNTILQDNPSLDARDTCFAEMSRTLFVMDSKAELLNHPALKIFSTHGKENLFLIVDHHTHVPDSAYVVAQILRLPARPEKLVAGTRQALAWGLEQAVAMISDLKIQSLWIEGGAQILSAALQAGIGHRLWLFQGPHLLGGDHGLSWTRFWGVTQMKNRRTLGEVHHLSLGFDHLTCGRMLSAKS